LTVCPDQELYLSRQFFMMVVSLEVAVVKIIKPSAYNK